MHLQSIMTDLLGHKVKSAKFCKPLTWITTTVNTQTGPCTRTRCTSEIHYFESHADWHKKNRDLIFVSMNV